MPSDLAGKSCMTVEIRPGIHRPDWSVLTRPAARETLLGRDHSRLGFAEKWNQALEPEQDHVWRTVLELFARSGRPPHLHEIGKETGLSVENLQVLVAERRRMTSSEWISWPTRMLMLTRSPGRRQSTAYSFAAGNFTPSVQSMLSASPACFVRT